MSLPARLSMLLALTVAVEPAMAAESAGSRLRFRQVADSWGLDFQHHHGGSGERYMAETVVGGVVLFDYDGDGDVDVFFVDGGVLPGYVGETPASRLYRNDGGGSFVDVSDAAAIDGPAYGCGAVAADIDNDLDLDLYVTAMGANRLLRNEGDGTFREVGGAAGVAETRWSASAAFSDLDRDGDLDLYVTNYVDFTLETHKFCGDEESGLQGYCHPSAYEGLPDRYYRNLGDGSFEDATSTAGFSGAVEAGLGVVIGDLDGDRWPDVYVANDADPNFLFRNLGDGTFEDVSVLSGTALADSGRPEGSMGLDLGDVDGDGRLDIFVANFDLESNALYRNLGSALFSDSRFAFGLGEPSLLKLAFGTAFADFDHDADLDLVVANGHILDNADAFRAGSRYAQRNQLFENIELRRLREVEAAGLDEIKVSRGLAAGDLDADGDLDLVIVNSNERADVYENLSAVPAAAWLQVDLAGSDNRFGVDAWVELEAGGRRQVRQVRAGSSYLSQHDLTLHFGLAGAEPDSLEVAWPGGKVQRFVGLMKARRYRLHESG